ncbi:uncharacterized protein LOC127901206 [Citrus sinensis]|uniref:uncharacterized protein LOC127901206 n=1 Tax=Citrus sinensis TaxID=2711 RepID=UPI002277AE43|nr:uncharacterized protein LOC127901206 [Citrus sinensis]
MKPQLLVEASKVTDAVQFYKTAFDAVEINSKNMGIGCVLCLEIGDVEAALAKVVSAGIVDEGKLAKGNSAYCCGRLGAWKRSRIHVVSHGSFALRSRRTLTWKLESGLI